MSEANDDLLWVGLHEISKQTVKHLGERAHCFVELFNDWLDISRALSSAYPQDLPLNSLLAADFVGLGKELHWLHRLLHWGNYPLIARVLRYDWELMFRAYYADVYQPSVPGDADVPGSSVDGKVRWLETRGPGLHFNSLIVPILNAILPGNEREHFKQIWRGLNQHVHPTERHRYRMIEESALAVRDGFDKKWAEATIDIACDVYDLIWLMTLRRFPSCVPLLNDPRLFKYAKRSAVLTRHTT